MPTQISEMADARLNELSRLIGKTERRIRKFNAVKDKAWDDAFDVLDEFNTAEGTRFIATDGHTLTRQKRQATPKLNEELLLQRLQAKFPDPVEFTAIWSDITSRSVMGALLERAVHDGRIPVDLVNDCMSNPSPTYARIRREWTKDDEQKSHVFRIHMVPEPEDVEEVVIPLAEYEELQELRRQMSGGTAAENTVPMAARGRGRPRRQVS